MTKADSTELSGFVTRDAEAKTSAKGNGYILINVGVKNKEDGSTKYIRVLSFDRNAEAEHFTKGCTVRVVGKLSHEKYVGKDGVERDSWTCLASKTAVIEKPKTKQTAWWDDNNE
jgi:single-stranded DNA-binding protein